jgi:hypothetical protein
LVCVQPDCDDSDPACATLTAQFIININLPTDAQIIDEACVNNGGVCNVEFFAPYSAQGKLYEMFTGVTQDVVDVEVESCAGTADVTLCLGNGMSQCADPTQPAALVRAARLSVCVSPRAVKSIWLASVHLSVISVGVR